MKTACSSLVVLIIVLFLGFYLPSWWGNSQESLVKKSGSETQKLVERPRHNLAQSQRQRFEQSLSDPPMILELMPELVESTYFRYPSRYRELLSALKYFDDDQLVELIEMWPENVPLDAEGKAIKVPGTSEFIKDVWNEAVGKQTPPDQQAKRGIEIARKTKLGTGARAYMFRYSINQSDQFTPDDFSFLMKTKSLDSEEILMITGAIGGRHYEDLKQGKTDAINDYLQLTDHPDLVSSLVSDVIRSGSQDSKTLTSKSKWLSSLDDEFLSSSDNSLVREAVNAGLPELAKDHIERLRENSAKRRADSAARFLQGELRK